MNNLTAASPSLRSIMTAEGDSSKQIWVTEYGAPTGTHNPSVTVAQQSKLITGSYAKWKTYSWAGPLFWFTYSDTDAGTGTNGFGIGNNPASVAAYTQAAQ